MTDFLLPKSLFSLEGYQHHPIFENLNYAWEALSKINDYLNACPLGKIEVDIPSSVHLINPHQISIGAHSIIEPGAYIQGPCVIGTHCQIRHGAYIRGQVLTGDYCIIGHDTEIKNSILLNHAKAAHFNYVGDSILGNRVNLGAGVKCANFKLIGDSVVIRFKKGGVNYRFDTQLCKLGAIIGDGSQLGCNSVTNPGTILGRDAMIYPCLNIGGYIPDKKKVKNELRN